MHRHQQQHDSSSDDDKKSIIRGRRTSETALRTASRTSSHRTIIGGGNSHGGVINFSSALSSSPRVPRSSDSNNNISAENTNSGSLSTVAAVTGGGGGAIITGHSALSSAHNTSSSSSSPPSSSPHQAQHEGQQQPTLSTNNSITMEEALRNYNAAAAFVAAASRNQHLMAPAPAEALAAAAAAPLQSLMLWSTTPTMATIPQNQVTQIMMPMNPYHSHQSSPNQLFPNLFPPLIQADAGAPNISAALAHAAAAAADGFAVRPLLSSQPAPQLNPSRKNRMTPPSSSSSSNDSHSSSSSMSSSHKSNSSHHEQQPQRGSGGGPRGSLMTKAKPPAQSRFSSQPTASKRKQINAPKPSTSITSNKSNDKSSERKNLTPNAMMTGASYSSTTKSSTNSKTRRQQKKIPANTSEKADYVFFSPPSKSSSTDAIRVAADNTSLLDATSTSTSDDERDKNKSDNHVDVTNHGTDPIPVISTKGNDPYIDDEEDDGDDEKEKEGGEEENEGDDAKARHAIDDDGRLQQLVTSSISHHSMTITKYVGPDLRQVVVSLTSPSEPMLITDVCFGLSSHPGTKEWRETVTSFVDLEWSDNIFHQVLAMLKFSTKIKKDKTKKNKIDRRFLIYLDVNSGNQLRKIHNNDQGMWCVATSFEVCQKTRELHRELRRNRRGEPAAVKKSAEHLITRVHGKMKRCRDLIDMSLSSPSGSGGCGGDDDDDDEQFQQYFGKKMRKNKKQKMDMKNDPRYHSPLQQSQCNDLQNNMTQFMQLVQSFQRRLEPLSHQTSKQAKLLEVANHIGALTEYICRELQSELSNMQEDREGEEQQQQQEQERQQEQEQQQEQERQQEQEQQQEREQEQQPQSNTTSVVTSCASADGDKAASPDAANTKT